jgi:6,7-dimethyl-8-ribityllumazine synthase
MTQRIAFIQSSWHADLTKGCRDAFLEELARVNRSATGGDAFAVDGFEVPGAFEIPLHAKLLAKGGRYAAVAAAGLVVDGGIYRHEFVAQAVIDGLMRVQLETEVPVFTAVLTPQQFHEHEPHRRFFAEHAAVKGRELAVALVQTLGSLQRVRRGELQPA